MIRRVGVAVLLTVVSLSARTARAQSADLSVTLSGPSTVIANYDTATPTVTVSITNAGPATVQDLTIDFDPGLSINLPSFTCSTVANHVRCTTSSFSPKTVQGSGSVQVHQPVDGAVVTMSATVSSATIPDPNPANNTSSVSETVVWESFVSLDGIALTDMAPQGGGCGGGIYYVNPGPSYATDVQITFSIPQHATFQSASWNSSFSCVTPPIGSPGDIVCTAKKLGDTNHDSQSEFIGFVVGIDPTTPLGTTLTFTTSMTCSDAGEPPQPIQSSVTIVAPAHLTSSLASPASVEPGDAFANDVTVTNSGPAAAINTTVTFTVSNGGVITSALGPAGWNCSVPILSRATCSISSFPPGTATFSFPVSVPPDVPPGKLTESVFAMSVSDSTASYHATATTWISLEKIADFNLRMVAPPIVHPGGTVTYTMVATNTTVNAAFAVLVLVTTPGAPITWNCPGQAFDSLCSLGTMAGGSSRTVTATIPVLADSPSNITGTAWITGGNTPFLHDARATVISSVQPLAPDLAVALTASSFLLTVGDTVTFTILVTNTGEVPAPNVTVYEPLAPSLAFVSSTGHCTSLPDVRCSVGNLAPGAWSSLTVTARAYTPGTVKVIATAVTDVTDPQASNNSATVPITVTAPVLRRRAARH